MSETDKWLLTANSNEKGLSPTFLTEGVRESFPSLMVTLSRSSNLQHEIYT